MKHILFNQIAVGLFLIANLVVGYLYRGKKNTMAEYALASKSLSGGVLVMTLIATLTTGGAIGIKYAYSNGLISLFETSFLIVVSLLLGNLVFPKLTSFKRHYTIGDVMGELYGYPARLFSVVVATAFSLLIIIGQLTAFGQFGSMVGISPWFLIMILGIVVTLYTFLGGVRSVAATDVLQFLVLLIGVCLFSVLVVSEKGGIGFILTNVDPVHLKFWRYSNLFPRFISACFWAICPTVLISPPIVQRMLMTSEKNRIKNMFVGFSFFYPLMRVMFLLVGLGLLVDPSISSIASLDLGTIIEYACHNLLGRAVILIAIVGILMSTIDSFLNALAILWVNDVVAPWYKNRNKEINLIEWLHIMTGVLGFSCTLIASLGTLSFRLYGGLAVMAYSLLCLPFLAGILGMKGSNKTFFVPVAVFLATFGGLFLTVSESSFLTNIMNEGSADGNFPGKFILARVFWLISILTSTLIFFLTHYLENGAFVIINREKDIWEERHYKLGMPDLSWLTTPMQWARAKVARHGSMPYFFGMFMYTTSFIPYMPGGHVHAVGYLAVGLRCVSVLLITLVLLESIWPKRYLHLFDGAYLWSVFYCIPFVSNLLWLNSPQGLFAVGSFLCSIVLLIFLTDWRTFFLFEGLSMLLGLVITRCWQGSFFPYFIGYEDWIILFFIGYLALAILVFLRKKEDTILKENEDMKSENERNEVGMRTILRAQGQMASSLDDRSSMITKINETLELLGKKKDNKEGVVTLQNAIKHLQQMAKEMVAYRQLAAKEEHLDGIFKNAFFALVAKNIDPSSQVAREIASRQKSIVCDGPAISQLITNAISYLATTYPNQTVSFKITDTKLSYPIPGEGSHTIAAINFVFSVGKKVPTIAKCYDQQQQVAPVSPGNLPLSENARTVYAHYGAMQFFRNEEDATIHHVIPVNVKAVRPSLAHFADEDLLAQTTLDAPEDKAFLKKVAQQKGLDLGRITDALKVAKHYHREQFRKAGEPYYSHPVAVAEIALPYTKNTEVIIACLLHDTVEDTAYTLPQLTATFGAVVGTIVDQVTHLHSHNFQKLKINKKKSLQHLLKENDHDALLVKLCDRLHNMQTIAGHRPERAKEIAQETLDIFVPLARDLKIPKVAEELEKICRKVLG